MKCPRCETTSMTELDRDGVTIDRCEKCRGIWLDRGELEKLIARDGGGAAAGDDDDDDDRRGAKRRRDRDDEDDDDDDDRGGGRRRRWWEGDRLRGPNPG